MKTIEENEKIQNTYNELYKGKEFVYLSKYGGVTFGVIKEFRCWRTSIVQDEETSWLWRKKMSKNNNKVKPPKGKKPVVNVNYSAYTKPIEVVSENGVVYDFNEIKIIFSKKIK